MDGMTRRFRGRLASGRYDGAEDPAVAGLTELIGSELQRAQTSEPELLEQADPGRVWLLWFAIGATDAVCELTARKADVQRNDLFRQVVAVIFDGKGVRASDDSPDSDRRLIELFESAGSEAVEACMRGDARLGYYVEALRVSRRRDF
jgi:hypothetical protein